MLDEPVLAVLRRLEEENQDRLEREPQRTSLISPCTFPSGSRKNVIHSSWSGIRAM